MRVRPQTPGSSDLQREFVRLYQRHITVRVVLTSQLQPDMKASPTLQLFGTGPEGGKCCYNMMIKGDQRLPGS